jgi:hypothetical protein
MEQLSFNSSPDARIIPGLEDRKDQCGRLLRLLIEARRSGNPKVPLTRILQQNIAQYNARFFTLRRQGFDIRNETKIVNGEKYSWFWLETETPASMRTTGAR